MFLNCSFFIHQCGTKLFFSFKLLQALHLLCLEEFVDSAQMLAHALASKLVDLCHEAIEKITVVADNDERAIVVL